MAAANPTLRRVAAAAEARMRAARAAGPKSGASIQRISDWKAGRNVPARFEVFLPVLLTLIDEARKASSPVPPVLLDVREWQRLWTASNEWDPNSEAADVVSPYLGLAAYGPEDTEVFFGRARPTTELADLVRRTTAGDGGLVLLVGASGAGKSSLLQAGLIPALVDSMNEWAVATLTPGPDPVRALVAATAGTMSDPTPARLFTTGGRVGTPAAETDPSGAGAAEPSEAGMTDAEPPTVSEGRSPAADSTATRLAVWGKGRQRLIVVDQLEELFTLCPDEGERAEFLDALAHLAIRGESGPVAVVLAVRADFYARCLDEPVLEDALKHRSYLLGPMRLDELAEAITRPAESAGYKLESGLEGLVISELCGLGGDERRSYDPGALPLVSHAMEAVWQRREGSRLTIEGYRAAGGVLGSVAATAEQAWGELTEFQQAVGKQVLLGLVAVGDDSRDTRRRVSHADLLRQSVTAAEAALDALARTRLITLEAETAYLTHEIVLDAWPRLRSWIDEDRVGFLERQRLQADADDWVEHRRDPALLYRGARLVTMREHARRGAVGPVPEEFLRAAESARRRADRRTTARRTSLILLTVVSMILAGVAFVQNHNASRDRDAAVFKSVLAEADRLEASDPSLSAQLVLVAARMRPRDPEVLARLVDTESRPLATPLSWRGETVTAAAFRSDGRLLATASDGIHLWDISDRGNPRVVGGELHGGSAAVSILAFGPGGRTLGAATIAGDVRLWDTRDPEHLVPLGTSLHIGIPTALGIGPDGSTLVTGSLDGAITFWDITDPARPHPIGTPIRVASGFHSTYSVMFSADLRRVVTVSAQGAARVWDVTDPHRPAVPIGDIDSAATAAALSPDGRVAVVMTRNSLEIWDCHDASAPARFLATLSDADTNVGAGLAFRADSRVLAYPSTGGGVALTGLTELSHPISLGRQLTSPLGFRSQVTFGPDGHTVVIDGHDGAYLWSLPDSIVPEYDSLPRGSLNMEQDRTMLVGDEVTGRHFESWRVDDSLGVHRIGRFDLPETSGSPGQLLLGPDGRKLIFHPAIGNIQLFDISESSGIAPSGELPHTGSGTGNVMAFGPDGNRLFVGWTENGAAYLQIWDLHRSVPALIAERVPLSTRYILALDISPDGKYAAVLSEGGRAELWSVADPAHVELSTRLQPSGSVPLTHVRFGPGGDILIATAVDRTMRVWDTMNRFAPVTIGDSSAERTAWTSDLAFSGGGRYLAYIDGDSAIRLWDFSEPAHPRAIEHPIGTARPAPMGGTVAFLPDGRHLIATGADGLVHFWDLDPTAAITRICATTRTILTPQIWREHLPESPYRPPCS
ncbi:NACHT and WD repeat domain-containing protein [Nocardia sp. alder85J]|uniref:NACHT and WD repeat domain-containing protein n=1 Tax=Nocardia sp. alder85J TaxID=2862949 RepID=UPI001CD6B497|nr:NACHT and WD repeat domain-containing protein [Nocardia sp. alder85J]MCX4095126.1 NACHT and WD repeat domain-containing protein [Nocardia sp. alder85J]